MLSLQNYTKFLNKEQTFFLKIFKISCKKMKFNCHFDWSATQ